MYTVCVKHLFDHFSEHIWAEHGLQVLQIWYQQETILSWCLMKPVQNFHLFEQKKKVLEVLRSKLGENLCDSNILVKVVGIDTVGNILHQRWSV